jgi:hypothetical protein
MNAMEITAEENGEFVTAQSDAFPVVIFSFILLIL